MTTLGGENIQYSEQRTLDFIIPSIEKTYSSYPQHQEVLEWQTNSNTYLLKKVISAAADGSEMGLE